MLFTDGLDREEVCYSSSGENVKTSKSDCSVTCDLTIFLHFLRVDGFGKANESSVWMEKSTLQLHCCRLRHLKNRKLLENLDCLHLRQWFVMYLAAAVDNLMPKLCNMRYN